MKADHVMRVVNMLINLQWMPMKIHLLVLRN